VGAVGKKNEDVSVDVAEDGKIGAVNHQVDSLGASTIQGIHASTFDYGFNEFLRAQLQLVRIIGVRSVEDLEDMIVSLGIGSGKGRRFVVIGIIGRYQLLAILERDVLVVFVR
jgi:hypothetical protein